MNERSFEQVRSYAQSRLENELSEDLLYHRAGHTREEVVPAVEKLAAMEGILGEALLLLRTAAWFHDLGYIHAAANHEATSAQIAAEVLPGFGYSPEQVDTVRRIIMATALPQSPDDRLEEIMADADLYNLGGDSYMARSQDLRAELARAGKIFTDREWIIQQVEFLEEHHYFTASARALRDEQKQRNVDWLRRILDNS